MADLTADDVIRLLDLKPHPEGGHFRETFRDAAADAASTSTSDGARATSTAIYFLLKQSEQSAWHTVDAVEVWHHYAGAPLLLEIAAPGGPATRIELGANLAAGQRPQAVVPRDHFQRARSFGEWTLVGCTVAPGFEFAGFRLADPDFDPPPAR